MTSKLISGKQPPPKNPQVVDLLGAYESIVPVLDTFRRHGFKFLAYLLEMVAMEIDRELARRNVRVDTPLSAANDDGRVKKTSPSH